MLRFLRRSLIGLIPLFLLPLLVFTVLRAESGPIVEVSPSNGATNVWLGTSIRVVFAAPMDRASVEARFWTNPSLPGRLAWSSKDGRDILDFLPDDILAPATTYKITLQAGVRNAAGNPVLAQPFTWSFTSGQVYNAIQFGWGLPVQLVDPAGSNRVQLWAGYPRMRVDFALHALSLPEFAARYGLLNPSRDQTIDVRGLTQIATWQRKYDDPQNYTTQDTALPPVPPGIYVLTARHPLAAGREPPPAALGDEMFVIVGRYVLALKQGAQGQVVAWATRLQDGTPAAGMAVTLYDAQGAAIAQGTTDADGVATLDAGRQDPNAGDRPDRRRDDRRRAGWRLAFRWRRLLVVVAEHAPVGALPRLPLHRPAHLPAG